MIALFLDDPPGLVCNRLETLGLRKKGLAVATHLDADTQHPSRLLDALAEEVATRRPVLIILDALYVLLKGAEQLYHAGEMAPLMRRLDRIAEESGAAVVLIHHPRKGKEDPAGSFAIRASAKSILNISRHGEGDGNEHGNDHTTRRMLRVEGKFLPETRHVLEFSGPGKWRLLGEAGAIRKEDLEASVVAEISGKPGLTAEDLAGRLSRRPQVVRRILKQLDQTGRVHSREILTGRKGRPGKTWWPGKRDNEGF